MAALTERRYSRYLHSPFHARWVFAGMTNGEKLTVMFSEEVVEGQRILYEECRKNGSFLTTDERG